jgi:hypothetical protein
MFGSLFVTALLRRYSLLKRVGGAMLGWIAGDIAISDPVIVDWVNQQSPALPFVVPILTVVFVLVESRIMEDSQSAAQALRPRRRSPPVSVEPRPAVIEQAAAPPIVPVAKPPIVPVAGPSVAVANQSLAAANQSVAVASLSAAPTASPVSTARTADTPGHVQAPRRKRFKRAFWITAVIAVALLWMLFKFLSLDFDSATPALQFTAPTTQH